MGDPKEIWVSFSCGRETVHGPCTTEVMEPNYVCACGAPAVRYILATADEAMVDSALDELFNYIWVDGKWSPISGVKAVIRAVGLSVGEAP